MRKHQLKIQHFQLPHLRDKAFQRSVELNVLVAEIAGVHGLGPIRGRVRRAAARLLEHVIEAASVRNSARRLRLYESAVIQVRKVDGFLFALHELGLIPQQPQRRALALSLKLDVLLCERLDDGFEAENAPVVEDEIAEPQPTMEPAPDQHADLEPDRGSEAPSVDPPTPKSRADED